MENLINKSSLAACKYPSVLYIFKFFNSIIMLIFIYNNLLLITDKRFVYIVANNSGIIVLNISNINFQSQKSSYLILKQTLLYTYGGSPISFAISSGNFFK